MKKKKTIKKDWNIFKVLNQRIVGMGYSYSLVSFGKNFLLYAVLILCLGSLHKLDWLYIGLLLLVFLLMLPFSIYAQYKYLYEQKRFQELCLYMKQMKINFKTHKKILIALEETITVFDKTDRIYPYIEQAIKFIRDGGNYNEALDIVEKPYKNSYVTKLHAYMVLGENEGGDSVYQALDNIDYENWKTDTFIYMTQKYKVQNKNGGYTLFGLVISLVVIIMIQIILKNSGDVLNDVFANPLFQIETFAYMLIILLSYICIKTLITSKWIREDE